MPALGSFQPQQQYGSAAPNNAPSAQLQQYELTYERNQKTFGTLDVGQANYIANQCIDGDRIKQELKRIARESDKILFDYFTAEDSYKQWQAPLALLTVLAYMLLIIPGIIVSIWHFQRANAIRAQYRAALDSLNAYLDNENDTNELLKRNGISATMYLNELDIVAANTGQVINQICTPVLRFYLDTQAANKARNVKPADVSAASAPANEQIQGYQQGGYMAQPGEIAGGYAQMKQ